MYTLYLYRLSDDKCLHHDGYVVLGVHSHGVEKHMELNPKVDWLETYWCPDVFSMRYKRANFQATQRANEGSPRTDNAADCRPRDFPHEKSCQPQQRLDRAV